MKRTLTVFLVCLLCLCTVSCHGSAISRESRGEELTSLVDEMVKSDEFIKIYLNETTVYDDMISDIRKADYSSADAVYRLDFSEKEIFRKLADRSFDIDKLSERLQSKLMGALGGTISSSIMSAINSSTASEAMVLSSIFAASTYFVDESVTENEYYLYTFEGGYPMLIYFIPHEGGAVSAGAYFIINSEFKCSDANEINESFESFGLSEITATKTE